MCKVYNEVGCITVIKEHLRKNGIYEYNSISKLQNFQRSYQSLRQQIIAENTILIEKEKASLNSELTDLDDTIKKNRLKTKQEHFETS